MTTTDGRMLMLQLGDGDYQDTEARFDRELLLAGFVDVYGRPKANEYLLELEHCEITLDEVWPGWRVKRPMNRLDPDTLALIKIPLARRRQILLGAGEWGLRLVWRDQDTPIALSVKPKRAHRVQPPAAHYERNYSRPHLAASTGIKLSVIESAMDEYVSDVGINARDWCVTWAESHVEGADATA